MSEKRSERILKTIKSAYLQQFEQPLDDHFLMAVVEKELHKKREAFLQIQLATSGLSIDEMVALKSLLGVRAPAGPARTESRRGRGKLGARLDALSQDEPTAELALEGLEPQEVDKLPEGDDSFDEVKKKKRRAYARAYYHKKKVQREAAAARPSKDFKTTPEQRAYQRAYYQRKKVEKLAFESGTLAKVAAKALEAQKQAIAKSSKNMGKGRDRLDYDAMAADRLAIEDAFRPSPSEEEGRPGFKRPQHGEDNALLSSLTMGPKTKLRKAAKAGSLTT